MTQFEIRLNDDLDSPTNSSEYILNKHHNYTATSNFNVFSQLTKFNKFDIVFDTTTNIHFTISFKCDLSGVNLNPNNRMIGRLKSHTLDLNFEVESEQQAIGIFTKISRFSLALTFLGLLQIFNYKSLMEKFSQNENNSLKVSLILICI